MSRIQSSVLIAELSPAAGELAGRRFWNSRLKRFQRDRRSRSERRGTSAYAKELIAAQQKLDADIDEAIAVRHRRHHSNLTDSDSNVNSHVDLVIANGWVYW